MSDLTDERIAELVTHWGGYALEERATRTALLELQRHRAAHAADEERMRSVVREAIELYGRESFVRREEVATRAAKQLASAAARLTAEDFSRIKATRDEMSRFMFLDQIPELIETLDRLLATVRQ